MVKENTMSDIDLQYELMTEGRMNLMHLPPGAIAWLWDRPKKQIQAAEDLAVAANAHGNPVADASLLKADQNILLIKCEGGECFRVYPDGGYSFDEAPMDIGGCSSVLQGGGCDTGCPMDDNGHQDDAPGPMDGEGDIITPDQLMGMMDGDMDGMMSTEVMDDIGNDEHMDTRPPESGVAVPHGMTNIAGEPTMDEDQGGDWGGPGASSMGGMGTGTPYVGDMDMSAYDDEDIDPVGFTKECQGYEDGELDEMAKALGVDGMLVEMTRAEMMDRYGDDREGSVNPPSEAHLEVYDAATNQMKEIPVALSWDVQPTEYDGPNVFVHGSATVDDMKLTEPVEINGQVYTQLNDQLAALVLGTAYQDEIEEAGAWEKLRDYISEKESEGVDIPSQRYPDSRGI
jgi:hypothetical protein